MVDKGKKLEADWQKLCKKRGLWSIRLYDTRSAGQFIPPQPSDYLIIQQHPEFIECKESDSTLLSFSNFQPAQLKAMKRARADKIKYTVIVLIKRKNYCSLDSGEILDAIYAGKKSIQLKDRAFSNSIDGAYI